MAGFDNNVMYADNVDFTGSTSPSAQVTADGELLIGSTAAPNIRVGSLASAGGTIVITVGSGTINLDTAGTIASSFPVDNGGPGIPLAGAMSFLGSTSTDFPNSSGLETHVGATTNEVYLENRRFLSALVVDPSATEGLRGEYTTITAALAAASAGDTIYVRPGTYTENITLVAGVNIIGATTSGSEAAVILAGSVTANYTGVVGIENLTISPAATDAFISAAGSPELTCIQCAVNPTAGTICSSANASFSLTFASSFLASPSGFDLFAPTAGGYGLINSFTSNGGTDRILMGGTSSINIFGGRLEHQIETTGTADVFVTDSVVDSGSVETFNINSAGSQIRSVHVTIGCAAASTNFAIGTGTYSYSDVTNLNTAENIAGTLTQQVADWKPYATAAATEGTVDKGTSGFDSSDFSVTNGFVSLAGSVITWREETGTSATFVANEGIITNNVGLVTLTLPATCAIGDTLRVCGKGTGGWSIAQVAGQTIHFDGQDTTTGVGGSLSSTVRYDCVELLCTTANTDFTVLSSVGNLTVV